MSDASFNAYSKYYDLFYRDKDYREEARFVAGLLRAGDRGSTHILELGCGTGGHAAELVKMGFTVDGIDTSTAMLERAQATAAPGFTCMLGDVRTFRANKRYDSVVSLFHVMSYQVTNADLHAAFDTAASHLDTGGLFVFDAWYGPAVQHQQPELRTKRAEGRDLHVLRHATPIHDSGAHRVDVQYEIEVSDDSPGSPHVFMETHRMRYLFEPEVRDFADKAGFDLIDAFESFTRAPLDISTWNAMFVASKR